MRQIVKDFYDLPKHTFVLKYTLPFIIILFIWFAIGNSVELIYKKNNLKFVKGSIISIDNVIIKVINKPLYKGKKYELRLRLNNYPDYFRLSDEFNYDNIIKSLRIGDTVTIYYRNKYLVPLTSGIQTDIYQLEFRNKILFDLIQRKQNSKGLFFTTLIASIILSVTYYYIKKEK
jgi:hypothetical protein